MDYIKHSYKWKLSDSIEDSIIKVGIDGVIDIVRKAAMPHKEDILKSGGHVFIEFSKDLKNNDVTYPGIPDDLAEKINSAL